MNGDIRSYYREADSFLRYTMDEPQRVADLRSFLAAYEEFVGQRVLDLACGGGILGFLSQGRVRDYLGVDCNPDMIEAANQQAQQRGASCRFLLADLRELDLTGSFDTVTLLGNGLCHFDAGTALRIVDRTLPCLTPGARFLFDYRDVINLLHEQAWVPQHIEHKLGRPVEFHATGYDASSGFLLKEFGPPGGEAVGEFRHAIWAPFLLEAVMNARGFVLEKRDRVRPAYYVDVYRRA